MKNKFPIFRNNPNLIYLDNAATTQKPESMIKAVNDFYTKYNSNVHRGFYDLSEKANKAYEDARKKVAKFINARPEEIIFTSGTTDSINSLAYALSRSNIFKNKSPKIALSELEHHSNYLPWKNITKNIEFLGTDKNYQIEFKKKKIDLITITQISNVTGTHTDPNKLKEFYLKAIKVVDAAQSIAHIPIDVKKLDIDFLAFSGHKIYGPTGIGILYGKKELLDKLEPLKLGGGMISSVTKEKADWAELPQKHEAGTPNITGAIGLGVAIDFVQELGFERILKHENQLREYSLEQLSKINGIEIYHPSKNTKAGAVISFNIKGVHAHDVAQILSDQNIAVRAGHHCCQILHKQVLKIPASVRVSFGIYNTREEIDRMIEALISGIGIFCK